MKEVKQIEDTWTSKEKFLAWDINIESFFKGYWKWNETDKKIQNFIAWVFENKGMFDENDPENIKILKRSQAAYLRQWTLF